MRTDLLPPYKRIRDFDFVTDFEVSSEEGFVLYVPREVSLGVDVEDSYEPYTEPDINHDVGTATEEEAESSARGTIGIGVDRVTHPVVADDTTEPVREDHPDLVRADGSLEVMQKILDVVITMPTATRSGMTQDVIDELISNPVAEALEAYNVAKNPRTKTEMEDEQQDDNVEANGNNGNGNGNGNGNPNVNKKGVVPVTRECTYQVFMKCQPLNFKGTERVIGLTRWFEKIEMVFHIGNFPPKYKVKYVTCNLLNSALTWWNSHKRIVGVDASYAMTWKELMKLMIERFQELTLLCTKMVLKEEDQVEKYIRGIPDNIQGNVISAKPTRLHDAICIANNPMDQKLKGYAVKNVGRRLGG
nr:hypothetical protein [Tanacetum cinerariifolium]